MNRILMIAGIVILLLYSLQVQSQQITGLWEVKEVKVGDNKMTPVAKWFRYNSDGTYQSGNGWLQNDEGTWRFESDANMMIPETTVGLKDPYGGFLVTFNGNNMQWEREEDGMKVVVSLIPVEKLPRSTADMLSGLWERITSSGKNEKENDSPSITEHTIFFRWDRIYMMQYNGGDRKSGYWHMNGHKPEVTLLPHQEGGSPETWKVEFKGRQLILTGVSDTNRDKVMSFQKLDSFPE